MVRAAAWLSSSFILVLVGCGDDTPPDGGCPTAPGNPAAPLRHHDGMQAAAPVPGTAVEFAQAASMPAIIDSWDRLQARRRPGVHEAD